MKTIPVLTLILLPVVGVSQEIKVHKGKKRIFVYDSTQSYGSIRLKKEKPVRKSRFDIYIGAGIFKPSENKKWNNANYVGLLSHNTTAGADYFITHNFSLGAYYNRFLYGQEIKNAGSFYMLDPANIFGIRARKEIHTKYFRIPFVLGVGRLNAPDGKWRIDMPNIPGYSNSYYGIKGVEAKVGTGIYKTVFQKFYVGVNILYNVVYCEGTAVHGSTYKSTFQDYPLQINFISLGANIGVQL